MSADKKLPALYLMDSIMKNVRQSNYLQLFAKNIVNNFVRVFEKVSIVILLTHLLALLLSYIAWYYTAIEKLVFV